MKTNRILIVGVLDVVGSTNIEMAKGFQSLGYEVTEYNYRTMLKKYGYEGMHQHLDILVNTEKFDLQVYCKVNGMNPAMLHRAKVAGPVHYWFMDNFEMCRQINAAGFAGNASFASATASDVVDRFKMVNKNAHHIFEGFNPAIYYYEDLPKIHDYLFIGNATVPRIIKIQELIRNGMNISIFGYGWPVGMQVNVPVFGDDERTEINSSKVVLNLCHDDVIFSDRVTKALACGATILSQPCKDFENHPLKSWISIFGRDIISTIGREAQMESVMRGAYSWEAVARKLIEIGGVSESTVR